MQTRSLNKQSQKEIFLQRFLLLTFYLVVTTGGTEARSGVKLGQRARTAPAANSRNTIINVWKESKGSARSTVNLETMSALSTSSNHPAGSAGPNATTRDAWIRAQVTQLRPKRLSEIDKKKKKKHESTTQCSICIFFNLWKRTASWVYNLVNHLFLSTDNHTCSVEKQADVLWVQCDVLSLNAGLLMPLFYQCL